MNFFVTILSIVLTVYFVFKLYKQYKTSKTLDEKSLFWVVIIVIGFPMIVYFLDYYDVLSCLNLFKNIDSNRFYDFIVNYISLIISASIGALVLVLMTIHEFKIIKDNENDQKRIQNIPIFDYKIIFSDKPSHRYNHVVDINENGINLCLCFVIENIGLNHARNIYYKIIVDNKEDKRVDLRKGQIFLKKGNSVSFDLIFNIDNNIKNRNVNIEVFYEDLVHNMYKQVISFELNLETKDKICSFLFNNEQLLINNEEEGA